MKTKTTKLLPLNLQFFSEEPSNEPADTPAAEPQKPDTQQPPKEEVKTIPYDRFKQVNDDLKSFKSTFESLGIDGVDSLKSLVEDYNAKKQADDDRKRGEMSEIDQLKADLEAKGSNEATLQKQIEQLNEGIRKQTIDNEFIKVATSNNIAYIDDAIRLADLSAVTVEDGKVVGIDDVVKSLVENKPYLLAQQKKVQKPIGEASNGSTNEEVKTLEAQLAEAKSSKNFSKVVELSNKIKGLIK